MTFLNVFLLLLLLTMVKGSEEQLAAAASVVSVVPYVADIVLSVLQSSVDFLHTFLVNIYNVMLSYDSFDQLVGSVFFWVAGITKHIFLESLLPS